MYASISELAFPLASSIDTMSMRNEVTSFWFLLVRSEGVMVYSYHVPQL